MRKSLVLAVCFLLLTAAAAHAEKIGTFNLGKVAAQCDASVAAKNRLKSRFQPKQNELDKERQKLESMVKGLNASSSDSKRQEAVRAQEAYAKKVSDLMQEAQKAEVEVSRELETLLNKACAAYAKRKGYTILFDQAAAPYSDPSMDVTNDILQEMNSLYKKK